MKQIIVIRKDLQMRKGKMIAQGAHASMASILSKDRQILDDPRVNEWLSGSFTKVCVYVSSEEELEEIFDHANQSGLLCSMIVDSGKTEFNGIPTKTAVAIGPDTHEKLLPVTGHLKLL